MMGTSMNLYVYCYVYAGGDDLTRGFHRFRRILRVFETTCLSISVHGYGGVLRSQYGSTEQGDEDD